MLPTPTQDHMNDSVVSIVKEAAGDTVKATEVKVELEKAVIDQLDKPLVIPRLKL